MKSFKTFDTKSKCQWSFQQKLKLFQIILFPVEVFVFTEVQSKERNYKIISSRHIQDFFKKTSAFWFSNSFVLRVRSGWVGRLFPFHRFGEIPHNRTKMTSAYYFLLKLMSKILGQQDFFPKNFCKKQIFIANHRDGGGRRINHLYTELFFKMRHNFSSLRKLKASFPPHFAEVLIMHCQLLADQIHG